MGSNPATPTSKTLENQGLPSKPEITCGGTEENKTPQIPAKRHASPAKSPATVPVCSALRPDGSEPHGETWEEVAERLGRLGAECVARLWPDQTPRTEALANAFAEKLGGQLACNMLAHHVPQERTEAVLDRMIATFADRLDQLDTAAMAQPGHC